jgi:hypothetical protein
LDRAHPQDQFLEARLAEAGSCLLMRETTSTEATGRNLIPGGSSVMPALSRNLAADMKRRKVFVLVPTFWLNSVT